MTDKEKLSHILKSASDRLYPSGMGETPVGMKSRDPDGDTPLHVFIWGGETEKALRLIGEGADVDAVGDMGETPLHAALHQHDRKVIDALLKAGARTDIVSDFGKSARDLAGEKGISLKKEG